MTPEEMLASDPGLLRCWREVVTREDPMTLDGIIACYGEPEPERRIIVPRDLVESIRETQAGLARHRAFLEAGSEERAYRWLTAVTG